MQLFMKIFEKFHELPKNLSIKQYRYFVFINYAFLIAGLFHFAYIFIFAHFGLKILSIYNIFSSLLWALCIYLNIRGWSVLQLLLANIEVIIHAVLCVYIMGWDSGFHYYILSVPMLLFLSSWRIISKIALCSLNFLIYTFLYYYINMLEVENAITLTELNAFNIINIAGIFFIISICAYYYRRIVLIAEQNLEIQYHHTTEALKKLNENLSDAAVYVKTILPKPMRESIIQTDWDFIPSESLGGDAFGYNWIDKENLAIFLIDVSGHGVSAALLSATIMNVLRSGNLPKADFCNPGEVLSALNKSFPSEDNNDMFFTIWYGVYNKRTCNLSYASGGHPHAILCYRSTINEPVYVQLGTRNNIIGGFENTDFDQKFMNLLDTSYLYIFSDGVYEFVQSDGNRWKYNDFIKNLFRFHFENEKDFNKIVSTIKQLKSSDFFEDDFTLLKVSFKQIN